MATKWHKGPPPSIGWWPASVCKDKGCIRWWSGTFWSVATRQFFTAKEASALARQVFPNQAWIMWTERPRSWPERSKT